MFLRRVVGVGCILLCSPIFVPHAMSKHGPLAELGPGVLGTDPGGVHICEECGHLIFIVLLPVDCPLSDL